MSAHATAKAIDTEANNAAADAASDARAEVLARSAEPKLVAANDTAPGTLAPAKAGKAAKAAPAKDPWDRFQIDVWLTNFNDVEFGIYKNTKNKAKSRQFTSDMDMIAEVTENGERTGLLGYREDLWTKNTGMDKRLVFKLFGEKLNWHATMDFMVGRSLQLTIGARGLPVTAFSLNTGDHHQMVYLERSANKWPLSPEDFSFFLLEDGILQFYRLRRDIFALGKDYTLYDQTNRVVGVLDGKLMSLGGKWKGAVLHEGKDKRLKMVLKLFCAMLIFNNQARRHISSLYQQVRTGKLAPKLEKQEADLYMNPRRVR
jgi:hypothetical protein